MKTILSTLILCYTLLANAGCSKKVVEQQSVLGTQDSTIALYLQTANSHDVEMENLGNGEWEIKTTGSDPYFFVQTDGTSIDLDAQSMLEFEYFSTTGIGRMLIFVGDVLDIPHLITYPNLGRVEGYAKPAIDLKETTAEPSQPLTSLRLTLGDHAGIVARIRSVSVRPPTEQERRLAEDREERLQNDQDHATRLQAYLQQNFASAITHVRQQGNQLMIEGNISGFRAGTKIAEIPLWRDATLLDTVETLLPVQGDGSFSINVDRIAADGYDRLLSGWAIVQEDNGQYSLASAMHYVDEQEARAALPPANPSSKKGIGGISFTDPDMEELGITSVTLNILLNDFIFKEAGANRVPYTYAGRTWYVDQNMVAFYDNDMEVAAQKNLMVSAIILIKQAVQAPGGWSDLVTHPEADPSAAFVMPNFTNKESVLAYAAAMNYLADRYSNPAKRIHCFIMHNEIQNAFFWASAGQKTEITYLDLYQKSMRLTQLLARQYDPNAKALISLDHGWTNIPDPRAYAGKNLLTDLVNFSNKDGNFEWGIAFHPYPQDITNPRTWEDNQALFNFNTPFITYKNLEVLDAWVKKSEVMFDGRNREVQLTEQSLNSPDYSAASLADQAAGMAYAWIKIDHLSSITAHQYHLQADAREEGGLKLGLRKYRDDADDPFGKKPIWDVYKALATPNWEQAVDFAKPILGIQSWEEVLHTEPIN